MSRIDGTDSTCGEIPILAGLFCGCGLLMERIISNRRLNCNGVFGCCLFGNTGGVVYRQGYQVIWHVLQPVDLLKCPNGKEDLCLNALQEISVHGKLSSEKYFCVLRK